MDMCSWLSTTCVLKNPLCRPSVPMCSAMSPTGQRREMATHGKDGFGAMATGAKLRHSCLGVNKEMALLITKIACFKVLLD